MKRLTAMVVLSVLALGASMTPLVGGEKKGGAMKETEYYPLKKGSTWEYLAAGKKVVVKVKDHEEINGMTCAKVETDSGGTLLVEYLTVKDDGVYRVRAQGQDIKPPFLVLKLPTKKGESWQNDCSSKGFSIKGKMTLDEEKISINKKDYDTIKVSSSEMKVGDQDASVTSWFAKGIGLVKQNYRVPAAGLDVTIELDKESVAK